MKSPAEEKRLFTRLDVGAGVRYQVVGEKKDNEALLDNVSAGGILFWSARQLSVDTEIHLTIDPDETGIPPIQIIATIVGVRPPRDNGQFGYRCRIDVTKNAKDSLTYRNGP